MQRRRTKRSPATADTLIQTSHGMRLRGSLAQQLGVRILSGKLAEGHVFPAETDLAAQLGRSRSVVREAFRVLAAKGMVDSRPKAGTRVSPRRQWSLLDPDLLAWQFESEPSDQFVTDLFELRMLIEPASAELAAQRRTREQVDILRGSLVAMAQHKLSTEAGRLADQRFHMTLLEATHNQAIIAMASSIMAAIAWTTIYKQRHRELPRDPVPEHRALCEAIAASDAHAARLAMEELIRLALADTRFAKRAG